MRKTWGWLTLGALLSLTTATLAQDAEPAPQQEPAPQPADVDPAEVADDLSVEEVPPDPDEPSIRLTVFIENDKFVGTDRFYTNGFKLAFQSTDLGWVSRNVSALLDYIPTLEARPLDWGLTVGHEIYTPEDVRETLLIPFDRHYSGWFYVGAFLTRGNRPLPGEKDPEILFEDQIALQIGLIGKNALGEEVQNNWHKFINVAESEGWDNQLRTEVGVQLYYQRKFLFQAVGSSDGIGGDLLPHLGVALGNVFTYAALGVTARLGWNIGKSFGPTQRIASAGLDAIRQQEGFSIYAFARLEGRAVLHNAFLDGTLVRRIPEEQSTRGVVESVNIQRERFVADIDVGVMLAWGPLTVSFTAIQRTREFEEQLDSFSFGAIMVQLTF